MRACHCFEYTAIPISGLLVVVSHYGKYCMIFSFQCEFYICLVSLMMNVVKLLLCM